MIIRNKQTGKDRVVTPDEYNKLISRGEAWATLYEVIETEAPAVPKELKKLSGKQKPEFEDDRLQTNTDGLLGDNPGEV